MGQDGRRDHGVADDMKVLVTSNPMHAYEAGNEFGPTRFVLAESFEDAWEEFITDCPDDPCDHGGDITDYQRGMAYAGEREFAQYDCDCEPDANGRWVWAVYFWMNEIPDQPVTFRATYSCDWWPSEEPDTDPVHWGGFCDPDNPWGTADDYPPTPDDDGNYPNDDPGEPIESVERHLGDAVMFLDQFPGGIWDAEIQCDPSQNFRTGVWTSVDLHVSGPGAEKALAIYDHLRGSAT